MKLLNFFQAARLAAACMGAALLVAACGGGGGDPGTSGTGSTTVKAASIDLSSSATTLPSGATSGSGVTITAIVKDSGNVAIADYPITFRTNYGTLTASGTNTNEQGVATAVLTAPTDTSADTRSNRDIVVAATAGSASKEIKVQVVGTRLSMSGDSSMGLGDSAQYRVVAQDSSGSVVPGATLSVSTAKSTSVLSATTLTTDQSGEAMFTYTPKEADTDTISVTGLGASTQLKVVVGASLLRLSSSALQWNVNQAHAVVATVRDANGGIPAAGTQVTFNTSRGCVWATSDVTTTCVSVVSVGTEADGTATAWFSSPDVGEVVVTALASDVGAATGTLRARYISTVPAQITMQANPSALRTSAFATNNSSTLEVLVRDAAGNPVQDVNVSFATVQDPSGGRLAAAGARTDANGRATNTYYAGARSSGTNEVRLRATVAGTSTIVAETTLTVGGDALTIGLGASNKIESAGNETMYRLFHTVYVTNAAGAPVASQPVTITLRPGAYGVGVLCWTGKIWARTDTSSVSLLNEDVNFNGVRDAGEPDYNGDAALSPGFVANIVPADSSGNTTGTGSSTVTLTTGSDGFAYFQMQYAKDYANWAQMQVQATTRVGGSESTNRMALNWLMGMADDYTEETVSPPGSVSPYGAAGLSCAAATTTTE
ncbi:MAG: Ig-like domain-containing protein [Pseudomonadota bacterium]|nr:Ig-like domain-containing protein [Pseudomonadota bacterium]